VRIALLHYAAHPVVGGVENVMREHSRLLARSGHQVRIMAGRGAQVDPEVEFVRMPLVDSLAPEILALKANLDAGIVPPEFHELSREIERQLRDCLADFDWLIAHNVCSLNKNLAVTSALHRIADEGRPRLVLWHHDLAWTTPRYRPQLHGGPPWDLLRSDWPNVIQVTVSEARQRELAQLLGVATERIVVIPNGIDIYGFLGVDPETAGLSERLGLLDADPLLLLPARVTPRKNIELSLRILGHLQQRCPRALLVVTGPVGAHNTGNPAYLESLVQLSRSLGIADRAIFLTLRIGSTVSDQTMRQLYRLADALLLPSREEGFGIPILEAGLSRIHVFCSDIPPLAELGRDDVTFFSPDADPTSVADIIGSTLSGDRMHALRKRVLQEHAWDRIYSMHLAPLLEEHPP
jgi:mannosylglucosylglycerate synthase